MHSIGHKVAFPFGEALKKYLPENMKLFLSELGMIG